VPTFCKGGEKWAPGGRRIVVSNATRRDTIRRMTCYLGWVACHAREIWIAVGPLAGVIIGSYIARRTQRKHWIADKKREEYRELITVLTGAFNSMRRRGHVKHVPTSEEQLHMMAAEDLAKITISDRIFIEQEVREMKILNRWMSLLDRFNADGDINAMSNGVGDIKANLVYAALQLLK